MKQLLCQCLNQRLSELFGAIRPVSGYNIFMCYHMFAAVGYVVGCKLILLHIDRIAGGFSAGEQTGLSNSYRACADSRY
ncbi:hypothetical protein D3C79_912450 [compost metagenome]